MLGHVFPPYLGTLMYNAGENDMEMGKDGRRNRIRGECIVINAG